MRHDHYNRAGDVAMTHDHDESHVPHHHEVDGEYLYTDEAKAIEREPMVFENPDAGISKYTHSVLQDWVMDLPLREQGTLLTGIRGCDLAPKNPMCIDEAHGCSTGEDTAERGLSAFLRYCILNPADPREVDIPGAWFQSKPPEHWKPSQFGHYPLHWYTHLMHCFEVVAYRHPDPDIVLEAMLIYRRLVKSLHLNPESKEQMIERLSEDRIATGEVVS